MYVKLFAQVAQSSLTQNETIETRGVFFMLLAIADREGFVQGTDKAIARIINVPVEQFQRALERLMAPDPDSQSQDFDGRRVMREANGLTIVNYRKYDAIKSQDQRREYLRRKKQESRLRLGQGGGGAPENGLGASDTPEGGGKRLGEAPASAPGDSGSESGEPPAGKIGGVRRGGRQNRPESIEACIEQGKMLNIPELVCRDFYLYNDARAVEGMNGEVVWMTGGEDNRAPVGNWVTLLKGWESKQPNFVRRRRSILTEKPKDDPFKDTPHIEVKKVVKTTPVLPPPSTPNLTYAQS